MTEDLAGANLNRSYTLAASNIAVFTFMLFFLYPRFEKGTINSFLFQSTLSVMGVSTFSLVFASFHYVHYPFLPESSDGMHNRGIAQDRKHL